MISIIVPAYNSEQYIQRCLTSILRQSYQDFEIIVIDDGSTDKTFEIIEKIKKTDDRISIIRKKNGGQSSARNMGLDVMCGDYYTFVDSDDEIDTDYLAVLIDSINRYHSDIAMCGLNYIKGENTKKKFCSNMVIDGNNHIIKEYLKESFLYGPVCKLYKASIFSMIRFKEGIIFEDVEYLSRIYKKCNKISTCDYAGYNYYIYSSSTTHSGFNEKKMDLLKVTDMICNTLDNYQNECEKEFRRFKLINYLTILLMIAETKNYSQYSSITDPLTNWIKKNRKDILSCNLISIIKKIYVIVFLFNNKTLIDAMLIFRSILK